MSLEYESRKARWANDSGPYNSMEGRATTKAISHPVTGGVRGRPLRRATSRVRIGSIHHPSPQERHEFDSLRKNLGRFKVNKWT